MDRTATAIGEQPLRQRNRMHQVVESATRGRINPYLLQSETLELGAVMCEAGSILDYAYFPSGCVLSLQTVLENGSAIETANLGSEGTFGLSGVLSSRVSAVRGVVRFQGPLIRCPLEALRTEVGNELICYLCAVSSESILMQVQQNVFCNARHATTARLCRWLLTMHDRTGPEAVAYPHRFFAGILDETYGSVALAAQSMQANGLISYQRGLLRIVDRPGLEQASCECYVIVKRCLDQLYVH